MLKSRFLDKGFSSSQLKILAVVCMTIDHIEYYLSGILPVPFWFGIIGRIAAPLFFFCTAKGLFYTHDRIAYCRRLYIAAVLMALGNSLINHWFHHPLGLSVNNAIFETLFYVVYFVTVLETIRSFSSDTDTGKKTLYYSLFILPFVIGGVESLLPNGVFLSILKIILPSPFDVEGGFLWVLFGIGLFYCMSRRHVLVRFYLAVCLLFFLLESTMGFTIQNLIVENHQWLMLLALPFILHYNGQKGKSSKWFFYVFYPAHIYVLVVLAYYLK